MRAIAPVYGGINLEDIAAPRCFEIERRLRELLDIPVFHDDQHGTAIVVLAALTNALRVVGKRLEDVSSWCPASARPGTRSSGCCTPRARVDHRLRPARRGPLRSAGAGRVRAWIATTPTSSGAGHAQGGAGRRGRLHGGLGANLLTGEEVATMAAGAIVFALANPDPEVDPWTPATAPPWSPPALGLPEPDQQRPGLSRLLPRPARRGRPRDHRGDDARRRDRHRRRGEADEPNTSFIVPASSTGRRAGGRGAVRAARRVPSRAQRPPAVLSTAGGSAPGPDEARRAVLRRNERKARELTGRGRAGAEQADTVNVLATAASPRHAARGGAEATVVLDGTPRR